MDDSMVVSSSTGKTAGGGRIQGILVAAAIAAVGVALIVVISFTYSSAVNDAELQQVVAARQVAERAGDVDGNALRSDPEAFRRSFSAWVASGHQGLDHFEIRYDPSTDALRWMRRSKASLSSDAPAGHLASDPNTFLPDYFAAVEGAVKEVHRTLLNRAADELRTGSSEGPARSGLLAFELHYLDVLVRTPGCETEARQESCAFRALNPLSGLAVASQTAEGRELIEKLNQLQDLTAPGATRRYL